MKSTSTRTRSGMCRWAGYSSENGREAPAWAGSTSCKAPLRRSVCPPLGWMGRHSLVLYLLHQPVILGVLTVAFRLVRAG